MPLLMIFNFLIRSTVHNTLLPMVPWWWSLSLLGSWSVFFKALLLLPFWRDYEIKPIFFPCVHDATLTPNQGQELDAIFFLLKSSTPIYGYDFHKNFPPFRPDEIGNNFRFEPENILLKHQNKDAAVISGDGGRGKKCWNVSYKLWA